MAATTNTHRESGFVRTFVRLGAVHGPRGYQFCACHAGSDSKRRPGIQQAGTSGPLPGTTGFGAVHHDDRFSRLLNVPDKPKRAQTLSAQAFSTIFLLRVLAAALQLPQHVMDELGNLVLTEGVAIDRLLADRAVRQPPRRLLHEVNTMVPSRYRIFS